MLSITTIHRLFQSVFLALTIAILFAACKGEVGPKGDTGPAGTPGVAGATGPAGASGVAGATGPAGVSGVSGTSSVTQVTYATSFTLSKDNSTSNTLGLPSGITKAVIDRSLVVVYVQLSGDPNFQNQVYQIPGIIPAVGDELAYTIYAPTPTTQAVVVYRTKGTYFTGVSLVRVLIIPAATVVNGRKAGVDYSNYQAVKAYYNLKE